MALSESFQPCGIGWERYIMSDGVFEKGKIYRYIGDGEWEIVDLVELVRKAIENAESMYND